MKVVFLNTWNAKVQDALTEFIKDQSRDTDVFCFQEVYEKMELLAQSTLSGYAAVERYKHVTDDDNFPQATYIRNNIPLLSSGTIMEREKEVGLGLYVQIPFGNKNLYICNFHGMSRPGDKLDTPERLRQSELLIKFFKGADGPKIIGGDFNVSPETKSIQMFKEGGYTDLIRERNIATTRNRLAWENYPHKKYYSDYVFISPDVVIKGFSVPEIEISDHLPLILEIENAL